MENYEDWLAKFGTRIRNERERQNLSRSDLAKMVDTEQGYIVQIERGSRSPSLKMLGNLLVALGVSADFLFFGADGKGQSEKEEIMRDFSTLLERGDTDDVKALYQMAPHLLRNKNKNDMYDFNYDLHQNPK